MKKITLIICCLIAKTLLAQSTAIYDISVTTIWTAEQHSSVPETAHWSPLAGATHNTVNAILELGAPAPNTNGIKAIAETGDTTNFENEILASITAGTADQYLQQRFSPFAGNDSKATLTNVTVSEAFPLVTLVSMVAPSPDWFIAVHNVNLRSGNSSINNGWKDSFTLDVFAYDSGTDSGTDYSSINSITPIRMPIALITDAPINGHKMATVTFTLQPQTLSTNTNAESAMDMYLSPNPAKDRITFSNLRHMDVKRIDIFSVLGKLSKSIAVTTPVNTLQMDISNLNTGVYIVRLTDGSGNTTKQKLIVS